MTCVDIDECALLTDNCNENSSKCRNTEGSFECECLSGFVKNGNGICQDVNECDDSPCDDNALCLNKPGSFQDRVGNFTFPHDVGHISIPDFQN